MKEQRPSRRTTCCSAILAIAFGSSAPALSGCDKLTGNGAKDDDGQSEKKGQKKAFDERAAQDLSNELKNTTDPQKAKKLIADLLAMGKQGEKAMDYVAKRAQYAAIDHDQSAWGKMEEAKTSDKKADDLLDAKVHIVIAKSIIKDLMQALTARYEIENLAKGVRTTEIYNQACDSYNALGGKGCPEFMSAPAPF